jgi:hypothetical protein
LLAGLLVSVLAAMSVKLRLFRGEPTSLALSRRQIIGIALAVVTIGYVGHYLVLLGYDLSRDEQLADFDAMIYAHGHWVWPLPAPWQADARQLNLLFMQPVEHPVAWVSAYLPGNSLLRAAMSLLGLAPLTSPLLAGLSVVLVWACARRLWPENNGADREVGGVVVLLLALSGQVVMTAMSAYAMSAHLCFNLLWLWLFLRDRQGSDALAVVVGFIGTGLHQPLFHPLFVAPFLVLLLLDRRWGRLAWFTGCYLLAAAFWSVWPWWTHSLVSGPLSSPDVTGAGVGIWSRLTALLHNAHPYGPLMAANLLRFVTWQHILLLPLLIAGFGAVRHDRMAAALAAGLVLPMLVMSILLAFQGNGFGYRYLHGVIGNAALIGGYGWRRLAPWAATVRPLFLGASLASLLITLPLQAWMAHGDYGVFAGLNARIDTSGAGYIILGADDVPLARDLVLNKPDLSNRPIRLMAEAVENPDALARRICRPGVSVAFPTDHFFAPVTRFFTIPDTSLASARLGKMNSAFSVAGCRTFLLE